MPKARANDRDKIVFRAEFKSFKCSGVCKIVATPVKFVKSTPPERCCGNIISLVFVNALFSVVIKILSNAFGSILQFESK